MDTYTENSVPVFQDKKNMSRVIHSYSLVPGISAGSSTKGDVKRPYRTNRPVRHFTSPIFLDEWNVSDLINLSELVFTA